MDCLAYCSASAYQIKSLFDYLKHQYRTTLYKDVIHVELLLPESKGDLFIFSFGATVFWGSSKEQNLKFLDELKPFEKEGQEELEIDEFTYIFGDTLKIFEDEIVLPNHETLTKLAVSFAIAQSVKLAAFEASTLKSFNAVRSIPEDLAKKGNISLSRNEIRKKMGTLFIERSRVNLHVDALDAPDFFWEYPELEPYYRLVANYLDLQTREEVLNKRLDIIHELFEMLGNELDHQHSSRLELTIILLIVIEVVLTLARDVFHVF